MKYIYTDHYKICDDILENVCNGERLHEVNIKEFLKQDFHQVSLMCEALLADGYIIHNPNNNNVEKQIITIRASIKGVQFFRDRGYKKMFEELNEKDEREKQLLANQVIISQFQSKLGKKIVIAGIVITGLNIILAPFLKKIFDLLWITN